MAKQRLTREDAEALALNSLAFLASDEARLTRFLQLTGLTPEALRHQAGDPSTLSSVLDYVLSDQSLLLVFASEAGIPPERVEDARALVSGIDNPKVWL
jgi:hypothetical protein